MTDLSVYYVGITYTDNSWSTEVRVKPFTSDMFKYDITLLNGSFEIKDTYKFAKKYASGRVLSAVAVKPILKGSFPDTKLNLCLIYIDPSLNTSYSGSKIRLLETKTFPFSDVSDLGQKYTFIHK